jgi:pimeloyl-ACP methyl ester carboxylesterase
MDTIMNRRITVSGLAFVFFLFALVSCDLFRNDDTEPQNNKYLVSKTLLMTYLESMVKVSVQAIEKAYPDASGLSQYVKYGFFVYKVEYNTTFNNQNVVASGLVCVPIASGTFPLLSFQNGTNTLHSQAPTEAYTDSLVLLIQTATSFGFVVAMPDYLGFGSSETMFHPYLHKASTIQSVTDLLRAVREMMADYPNTAISKEVYLMGYSQGGWASMALKKEMETNLTSEFTLKATSCGAGPYDLTYICNKILSQATYPQPYFLAYMVNSYIKSGEISLTYADIFNAPYSATNYISDLYNGTKDGDYINSKLSTSVSTLFTSDIIANLATGAKYATLRTALANNSVSAWKTTSPTFMMHGLGDTFVTPVVSNNLYLDFLAKGTSVSIITYIPIPALDHREAVIPWGLLSVKWIMGKKG